MAPNAIQPCFLHLNQSGKSMIVQLMHSRERPESGRSWFPGVHSSEKSVMPAWVSWIEDSNKVQKDGQIEQQWYSIANGCIKGQRYVAPSFNSKGTSWISLPYGVWIFSMQFNCCCTLFFSASVERWSPCAAENTANIFASFRWGTRMASNSSILGFFLGLATRLMNAWAHGHGAGAGAA